MPEEAQGAVLERPAGEASPTVASPDSGLGVSPAASSEQAAPDKQAEAYQKLQSERDKERAGREKAERKLAEVEHERQVNQALMQGPDPELYPEKAAEYRAEVVQHFARQARSEVRISEVLDDFRERTGIAIRRNDERLKNLGVGQEGWNNFQNILKGIEAEKDAPKKQAADRDELKKQLREELLKEMGVDTFDGGKASGGAGNLTAASFQALPFDERMKIRREQPERYDRLMANRG